MPRNVEEPPPSRPAYFWWLLANALALCFAIVSWVVCLDVFGNPEQPRNYAILSWLGRQPVLKKYALTEVPDGNSLSPGELYRRYFGYDDAQQLRANSLLLRNYLKNFESPLLLNYIEGDYKVEKARKMGASDFFEPGIVVRAQAMVKPDDFTKPMPYPVFIDYLLSTRQSDAASGFKPGDILSVKKSPNCAAVIHFKKIVHDDEPALLLTVVPIAGTFHQAGDSGAIQIEPPEKLRPGALTLTAVSPRGAARKP